MTLDATGSWILGISSDAAGSGGILRDWGIALEITTVFTSVPVDPVELPGRYRLLQNYPNPFNPATKIQFTIVSAKSGSASAKKTADRSGGNRQLTTVKVFDVLGRDVATLVNEVKEPGTYTVEFNASSLASGVYFYRLTAGSYLATHKMILMR
jgi:hypothetical protein